VRGSATIDLAQLPPPALIEALDAESYVAAALADYRARYPDFTAVLESEPVMKFIEVLAYRETLVRNRVNAAARATLLAYAMGADLDHRGAMFDVARLPGEDDDRFRRRIQLAPEAFSVAGPAGAYEFHALSADLSILDARAFSPRAGEVHVAVIGQGLAPVADAVMAQLVRLFRAGDVTPLTDSVTVRRAEIVAVDVALTLAAPPGPDPALLEATARAAVQRYFASRARIGAAVFCSGLIAAASAPAVENVRLAAPAADVICAERQIAALGALAVSVEIME
jgi:phage-related baseplate assembly protein